MTLQIKKYFVCASLVMAIVCVWGTQPALSAGLGRAVGVVQQVQGEVSITHADEPDGIEAKRGMRLYKGDTIRTLADGRLRLRLNDGSIISLASKTKLKLTRSVYEKKKKRRSSFFSMALGKARFFVWISSVPNLKSKRLPQSAVYADPISFWKPRRPKPLPQPWKILSSNFRVWLF